VLLSRHFSQPVSVISHPPHFHDFLVPPLLLWVTTQNPNHPTKCFPVGFSPPIFGHSLLCVFNCPDFSFAPHMGGLAFVFVPCLVPQFRRPCLKGTTTCLRAPSGLCLAFATPGIFVIVFLVFCGVGVRHRTQLPLLFFFSFHLTFRCRCWCSHFSPTACFVFGFSLYVVIVPPRVFVPIQGFSGFLPRACCVQGPSSFQALGFFFCWGQFPFCQN